MLAATPKFQAILTYWKAKANAGPQQMPFCQKQQQPVTATRTVAVAVARLQNLFLEKERARLQASAAAAAAAAAAAPSAWTAKKPFIPITEEKEEKEEEEEGTAAENGYVNGSENGQVPVADGNFRTEQGGCRAGQAQEAADKITENSALSKIRQSPMSHERAFAAARRFCECAERQKIARYGACYGRSEPAKQPKSKRCMDADHRACQFAIVQEIASQVPLPEDDDGLEEENHAVNACGGADHHECRQDDDEGAHRNEKGECESSGGHSGEIRGLTVANSEADGGYRRPESGEAAGQQGETTVGEDGPDAVRWPPPAELTDEEREALRKKAEELDKLFEARAEQCICLVCGGDDVAPPAGYESWKEWSDEEMPECICLVCCPREIPVPAGYESWEEWGAYETDCWCLLCGPWKTPYKPKLTDEEADEITNIIVEARTGELEARREAQQRAREQFWKGYRDHCDAFKHLWFKNFVRRIFGYGPILHWQPCLCHRIQYKMKQRELRQEEAQRKEKLREKKERKRVKRWQKEERMMAKRRWRG